MQSQIQRRFLVILIAVLMTTVVPWLIWGVGLQPKEGEDRKVTPYELKFGLDLKGGASITYRVTATGSQDQESVLADAIRVTQRRLDGFGLSEISILESGTDQFTVELPGRGKEEIDRIKNVMRQVGSLEFRIVADTAQEAGERARRDRQGEAYVVTEGYRWVPQKDGGGERLLETPDAKSREAFAKAEQALAEAKAAGKSTTDIQALEDALSTARGTWEADRAQHSFTGEDIAAAGAERNSQGLGYVVTFEMRPAKKAAFGKFTGDHIDRQMAIVLNGVIETAPNIKSTLPGGGQISSDFDPYTQETAQDLVTVLQSGALAATPEEISSFVVGPGLGEDAVKRGRIAVVLSFILVVLCMAWYYRGAGWVANLAVLLNLIMTLGVLMFLNAALSLPGIAGLILTLGMAVDANILVNERIREEKASGKGLLQAISAGYDRAFVTILDANLTTIITAAILYAVGTGPVRGFALTLILGLSISMFTALYVTRTLFLWGLERGILTEFRMGELWVRREYDFFSLRGTLLRASVIAAFLGALGFAMREREAKYDLEFIGGQRVVVALKEPMSIEDVRGLAAEVGKQLSIETPQVRTIRGRGVDSANLDLNKESDQFELTAANSDEEKGRLFTSAVETAFASQLVPGAVTDLVPGEPEGGLVPFTATLNFETRDLAAETVKEVLESSPVFPPATAALTVQSTPSAGSTVASFKVAGKASVKGDRPEARSLALTEGILKAVEARDGIDLSEPVPQSDFIGPGVARRLRDEAILAVFLSILVQVLYLRFRFKDFNYGFAAAIALVHDVTVTLGAVAVFDSLGLAHVKINLPVIASFLTLIGFSMNDTIVVFDRIRENLGRSIHADSKLLNLAINQTLARSIRTSITVLIVALTLFIVNRGAASSLEGFAFVMTVGVILGTYSSIAIAAPLLLFLPVYRHRLSALGRTVVGALLGAFVLGSFAAFLGEGLTSLVGGILAGLLPLHFLWRLFVWLGQKDPDALAREISGKAMVGATEPTAA